MTDNQQQTEGEASATPEVKRYQRQKLTARFVNLMLGVSYLLVLAFWAGPHIGAILTAWFGDSAWLRLVGAAVVCAGGTELLTLPLDFWQGYILEHREHLSNQTLIGWIKKRLLGWLVGALIGGPLLFGLYALLLFTYPWWLWAAVGWLLVMLVLGRLVPLLILPLFYKVTPLDDPALRERLERLVAGTGLNLQGVYRMELSAETRKANAALAGLGRSRRVLLGDTLLSQFTPEEIEVVFAHEVGHHVHRHLPKLVAISVAMSTLGFWLVDLVLHSLAQTIGYEAFNDPAALPLVLLILTVFGLTLAPAQNALSRVFERQCDRYALDRTGFRDAYLSAFTKLATINKSDPNPPRFIVWLLYDHPPIKERLAMAEGP